MSTLLAPPPQDTPEQTDADCFGSYEFVIPDLETGTKKAQIAQAISGITRWSAGSAAIVLQPREVWPGDRERDIKRLYTPGERITKTRDAILAAGLEIEREGIISRI